MWWQCVHRQMTSEERNFYGLTLKKGHEILDKELKIYVTDLLRGTPPPKKTVYLKTLSKREGGRSTQFQKNKK